jgi:8-amino-7-oxononanoate synthase
MNHAFLEKRLQERSQRGLLRKLSTPLHRTDFTSNDYFGFSREEQFFRSRSGATGSRLLTGNSATYELLEQQIAAFHRAESCLIYNSGYTANLGLISALGTPQTTFLYDLGIHASMIDGMALCSAKRIPFRHNDLESLESRLQRASPPCYVLIESLYSMAGDFAPLEEMVALCQRYQAELIVDEAHATGIYGPQGEGLVCEKNLETKVFARVHTFSKALGSHGACVAGNALLKEYLINFSRPFIYTTALPPSALSHIAHCYRKLEGEVGIHQSTLYKLIDYFCKRMGRGSSRSPIQPYTVKSADRAKQLSNLLQTKGFDVRAILPPTVPRGQECLRIVLHSFNTRSEIDQLVEVLS